MNKNVTNTRKIVFLTIDINKKVKVNEYTFSAEKKKKEIISFLQKETFNPETNEKFVSLLF